MNEKDEQGETALHKAARSLDPKLVSRLLLCSDLSTDVQDNSGQTPLHAAVLASGLRDGSAPTVVQRLVDKDAELTGIPDYYGCTPLTRIFCNAQGSLNHVYRTILSHEHDNTDSSDADDGICFTSSLIKTAMYLQSKTDTESGQYSAERVAERLLNSLAGWDAITNLSEAVQEPVKAAIGIMQAILLAPELRKGRHATLDEEHTVLQSEVFEGYRGWIFDFSRGAWHEIERTSPPTVSVRPSRTGVGNYKEDISSFVT